ncbi:four-helix bundle copper-binding protein [Deinococcus daejeonensis]|uniref:Four-helix bundle copper-binding protein n=1 Tax=Deinococcus daejeonensis TaxID=1007098 RepID=A0ABQ2J9T0_9DEIO|nr:four-helix bundle copper-binding protein [Deinococcus daejeonensis]GGN42580.1 hypothetical protein GCM10010842_29140 [Deinococcus daejeonensis]
MHTQISKMLQTHPQPQTAFDPTALAACLDACLECSAVCTACADACLGEQEHLAHLVRCIRLNLDCADICAATGRVLGRLTEADQDVLRAQLQACVVACRACGDECTQHAQHMNMAHCAVCADSCRRCEEACTRLLGSVSA